MADPNEVEIFKQYLKETNVFQSLVEIFSSLNKCDPKPSDPMQFVRKRLAEPSMDEQEFQELKRNVNHLNEEMNKIKENVSQIAIAVSKFTSQKLPNGPALNDSFESIENNIGDDSHISMLDESDIFEGTMNQTVIDVSELEATTVTASDSTLGIIEAMEIEENACSDGYTMEVVEVDVTQQSKCSQGFLLSSQDTLSVSETKEQETMMASTSNTMLTIEEASSAEKLSEDTSSELISEVKPDVSIENLPIVMKTDESSEPIDLSQPFCGFDSTDVDDSKQILSDMKDDGTNEPETVKQTDLTLDTSMDESIDLRAPNNTNEVDFETDTSTDAKLVLVSEIVEEVVKSLDEVRNGPDIEITVDVRQSEHIPMPKDDPETQFFLSFC